ncbi:MAG: guanylate kinase [Sodalis sp. Ffu]|nr:MAG: guanylate kinase [Sodalis sp. Ffu]
MHLLVLLYFYFYPSICIDNPDATVANTVYNNYHFVVFLTSTENFTMIQGRLYIVSAPSGTGKSTLINMLIKTQASYKPQVSISHTTRTMRSGEIHGKHYYFVPIKKFQRMITENVFLEHARVFDNYYGTSRSAIEQMLTKGIDVFLDIDWQGAQQIRSKVPNARSIFILPPSKKELTRRLRGRGQDSEKVIAKRMVQAITEITHFVEYDYLIVNDDFNTALSDLKTIIRTEKLRLEHQILRYDALISKLLVD